MRWWRYLTIATALTAINPVLHGSVGEVTQQIYDRAKVSESEVILIVRDGRTLGACGDERVLTPFETKSITKTFVSLAIGFLMQEGRIYSLDLPIASFFPEWNQGIKKYVTIRQLLTHTSGISKDEAGPFPDVVKEALASDFTTCPGTHFEYNNKATNLLAALVLKLSGMNIQEYLRGRLFQPLGIKSDTWLCDSSGNHYGMSHLMMNAQDLAKVGMLIAQDGMWNGRQLLAQEWVNGMLCASQSINPFYGLLCWLGYSSMKMHWDESLLDSYAKVNIPSNYISALKALNGRVLVLDGYISYGNFKELCADQLAAEFEDRDDVYVFLSMVEAKGLSMARWEPGAVKTIAARGHMGQQLIVLPDDNLVGVRLSRYCGDFCGMPDRFSDFDQLLIKLACEMSETSSETSTP